MATLTLTRSDKVTLAGEHRWFLVSDEKATPEYSPRESGDAGLRACLNWLNKHGYEACGTLPPEANEFRKAVSV